MTRPTTTGFRCWPAGGSSAGRTRAVRRGARRARRAAAGPDRRRTPTATGGCRSRVVPRVPRRGRASRTRSRSASATPIAEGIGRGARRRSSPAGAASSPATSQRATDGRLAGRGARSARCRTRSRRTAATGSSCSGCRATRAQSVEPRFDADGLGAHRRRRSRRATGVILALPHLGGFDFAAGVARRARASRRRSSSSRSSRPSSSSGSRACARRSGWRSSPLGPDAGRGGAARAEGQPDRLPALRPRPRGRRRRGRVLRRAHDDARRPGHARAAHRRAADPGGRVLPAPRRALREDRPAGRRCSARAACATMSRRITQELARRFEELIRMAPEQWHLMQPNWPSDAAARRRTPVAREGLDHLAVLAVGPGRGAGPGARARPRAARRSASTPGSSARATARRPSPASRRSGRACGS